MKCPVTEEQLALYAGGDLSFDESSVVDQHLSGCARCNEILAAFHFTRQLLADAPVVPNDADLPDVRSGVLDRLRRRHRQTRCIQVAALAASLALVSVPFVHREHASPHPAPVPVASVRPPTVPVPEVHPSEPIRRAVIKPVRLRQREAKARPELRAIAFEPGSGDKAMLKLATADPNVVILIQMNGSAHEN
jgi:anti-sigma factor RsiW